MASHSWEKLEIIKLPKADLEQYFAWVDIIKKNQDEMARSWVYNSSNIRAQHWLSNMDTRYSGKLQSKVLVWSTYGPI